MRHTSIPHFSATKTILIFQIKRIFSNEKWFNYVVPFFLQVPKIWVGRMTLNGEIKEDGLSRSKQYRSHLRRFRALKLFPQLRNPGFSFTCGRMETELFEYDDFIHHILLALRMLCKGCYRAFPSF